MPTITWLDLTAKLERNGIVADIISVVEKMKSLPRDFDSDQHLPAHWFVPDVPYDRLPNTGGSYGWPQQNKLEMWNTLKFFKVLKKHECLRGLEYRVGILQGVSGQIGRNETAFLDRKQSMVVKNVIPACSLGLDICVFTFRMDFELKGWPTQPPSLSSKKNEQF